jgi:hemerythrin-like domain-containing protein
VNLLSDLSHWHKSFVRAIIEVRSSSGMIQIGAPSATLDAPVEHLIACHRRIEQRLDTLIAAGAHLQDNTQRALEAIAASFRFLDSNGAMHTRDEEESLFPRLLPKLSAEERAYLDSLEQQHGQAEGIYGELKKLVAEAAARPQVAPETVERYCDCATRLRTLYREHIRSEDENLTPLARRLLTEPELAAITAEMRTRRSL